MRTKDGFITLPSEITITYSGYELFQRGIEFLIQKSLNKNIINSKKFVSGWST